MDAAAPFAELSGPFPSSAEDAVKPKLQRASGHARIVFRRRGGGTRLYRLFQEGCAKVRLPRIAGEPKEAVLINTAGGLTGGDELRTDIALEAGAHAVLTTQACERIYRSSGGDASVRTALDIADGARLDWLPQETILFNAGRLSRRLEADLAGDATLLALEAVMLGREAMGERVETGLLHDRWRIRRNGRLLFADDLRLDGAISELAGRASVLGGRRAFATVLLAAPGCGRLLEPVREAIGDLGGASAWDGKLLARIAAPDSFTLRRVLIPTLTVLRDGRPLPKVWQI